MNEKLFIFDLDGTLYEGTDHFDYYAQRLALDVAEEKQKEYWRDYEKMKAGEHPVTIGKAYDTKNDAILTVDPMTLTVVKAVNWEGEQLPEVEAQYGDMQIQFDFKNVIAIGDGWWLPCACAIHYGVEECYPRYVETKDYMSTDAFELEKIPELAGFLMELKEKAHVVLLTNSDEEDVARLLKELGLTGLFHQVVTSAQKPSKTTYYFKEIVKRYDVKPEETVSIGDNFINEIAPALLMGMKAVYISEHAKEADHHDLTQVERLKDWIEQMKVNL